MNDAAKMVLVLIFCTAAFVVGGGFYVAHRTDVDHQRIGRLEQRVDSLSLRLDEPTPTGAVVGVNQVITERFEP